MHRSRFFLRLAHQRFSSGAETREIFDRRLKTLHKDLVATRTDYDDFCYLRREVGRRLVDRLADVQHRQFKEILDLGCHGGQLYELLNAEDGTLSGIGAEHVVSMDSSRKMAERAREKTGLLQHTVLQGDEEFLPFPANRFDAVLSSLSLHWVNDIPGCLAQVEQTLKPNGIFLAAMFGGETLHELRTSLVLAEQERRGGLSPHVSPMIDFRDVGSLLTRAGFYLPTVDIDTITVPYPNMVSLMRHLWMMGESNAVRVRKQSLDRDVLLSAASIYRNMFGHEQDEIVATFNVIYMIGWKHDPSIPASKRRGSASVSMQTLASETGARIAATRMSEEQDEEQKQPKKKPAT